MYHNSTVVIVVAIGKNRELGNNNGLLWHIPEDLKRFRELTRGHPVLMGRKTFESILSILGKPLPGRLNVVISRTPAQVGVFENVVAVESLEQGLEVASQAPGGDEIHIGGGAQIYEQALPYTDTLYMTLVDDAPAADSFFPAFETVFTTKIREEAHEYKGLKYRWVDFTRTT